MQDVHFLDAPGLSPERTPVKALPMLILQIKEAARIRNTTALATMRLLSMKGSKPRAATSQREVETALPR